MLIDRCDVVFVDRREIASSVQPELMFGLDWTDNDSHNNNDIINKEFIMGRSLWIMK